MNRILLCVVLCLSTPAAFAERVSNDLLSYSPPPNAWKKEVKERTYTSLYELQHHQPGEAHLLPDLGVASFAFSGGASAAKTQAQPTALQGCMAYSPFTKTWTWTLRTPPPSK